MTAVTRLDKRGLLLAAVAIRSFAMPSKEPVPDWGTEAQPDPNTAAAVAVPDDVGAGEVDGEASTEGVSE